MASIPAIEAASIDVVLGDQSASPRSRLHCCRFATLTFPYVINGIASEGPTGQKSDNTATKTWVPMLITIHTKHATHVYLVPSSRALRNKGKFFSILILRIPGSEMTISLPTLVSVSSPKIKSNTSRLT